MKSIEHIHRKGAANLGIDEELFKEVYNYYWENHVVKNTVNAAYTSIYIHKFGTFRFSMPKVIREICAIIKSIKASDRHWEGKDKTDNAIKTRAQRIERLQQLLPLHNKLAIEAQQLRGGMITTAWKKKTNSHFKQQFNGPKNL